MYLRVRNSSDLTTEMTTSRVNVSSDHVFIGGMQQPAPGGSISIAGFK